jgi:RNA polymerase sigma factor (sigma-70 family)
MPRSDLGGALRQVERLFTMGTLSGCSDAVLLRRYVSTCDEEAFAGLVARHGPMVLSVCRSVLGDQPNVEDAFQATFLVLVRRARGLWVDESLGGWLHEVAYRLALRARADMARRRAREQGELGIDACEAREKSVARSLERELHEEIARLPGAYRKAVVLCYLEGMTQPQAAHELGCGEATLRRRLKTARERLRTRLSRGELDAEMAFSLISLSARAPLPAEWVEATVQAANAILAGRVATSVSWLLATAVQRAIHRTWLMQIAAVITLAIGTVIAVRVSATSGNDGRQEALVTRNPTATPAQTPATNSRAPAPHHWVHIRYDDGLERWVCVDNARELWKAGASAGLRDPDSNSELTYRGKGPIERRDHAIWMAGEKRPETVDLLAKAGVAFPDFDKMTPGRASEVQRKEFHVYFDYELEALDGRPCLRIDRFTRDTLGTARMDEQTWVELKTKRPLRRRELLQTAMQAQLKRQFRTSEFEYTGEGPADLFALGVPAGTKIVDEAVLNAPPKQSDVIRRVLEGGSAAVERLPLNYRLLQEADGRLGLFYWSCPAKFMHDWCAVMRGVNVPMLYANPWPRYFFADHQDPSDIPRDLVRELNADPLGDIPVSKLVTWFPINHAVNTHVRDGQRVFNLVRFAANPGDARRVELHVSPDQMVELPRPIVDLWPFLQTGSYLKVVPAEPGTPPRLVALAAEYDTIRFLWHCDPDHDFIAVRQVDWSKLGDKWVLNEDWNAARFRELPSGLKYVSAWTGRRHARVHGIDAAGKPVDREEDGAVTKRLNITPLSTDEFPAGIFDGNKLLETAREEHATIKVD